MLQLIFILNVLGFLSFTIRILKFYNEYLVYNVTIG